ncbi:hypothetical protein GCM10011506_26660 [Marivirga lumbricoides]|uniref:Uncharacterized protein n=1 Tax=Marivirga lumbricoides TaxID=1046115 RepID=A0ABQ1MGI6_9BACT|nr:hypothetical protein GCM10011506_26660 [Marivirga lumbricoides]
MDKIKIINQTIEEWFAKNKDIDKVLAKDLMPDFIKNGVFEKDHRKGLPIRNVLRELDRNDQLGQIPAVHPERKAKNTNWYFVRN